MRDMKAGDTVRTLNAIVIVRGMERTTIPAMTTGTVQHTVAPDAGFVLLHSYGGTLFLTAAEVEWNHGAVGHE